MKQAWALIGAAVVVVMVAGGIARAASRGSMFVATANSDGATSSSSPGGATIQVSSAYPVKFLRIRGTLTPLISNSFAHEAQVRVGFGATTPVSFSATPVAGYTGSLAVHAFVRLPVAVPNGTGLWTFSFRESYDDMPGPDAQWDNLTLTLDDGEPLALDLGVLAKGTQRPAAALSPGQITWFKFTLPLEASTAIGTFLDIDTNASSFTGGVNANDAYVVLFGDDGRVVAVDDDSGQGLASQLSFGAGTRPGLATAEPYAGQNGNLPAGVYYLGIKGYSPGETQEVGWAMTGTPSAHAGLLQVTINTNTGGGFYCPSDFNKVNGPELLDVFDFLTAWFSGCP